MVPVTPRVLILACGALARELVEIRRLNHWDGVDIRCLPATLHNTPEKIPAAVRAVLEEAASTYDQTFVAYADCGTAGRLDSVLEEFDAKRLPGAHCYQFFAGAKRFDELAEEEPGTFYLTDFLVRHFQRLVIDALGLERHPELRDAYFGNYRRVVFLAQMSDPELVELARSQAQRLGLDFQVVRTGVGPLKQQLDSSVGQWLS